MEGDQRTRRMMLAALLFLAALAGVAALKLTAKVTLPIAAAVFLSLVFEPVVAGLKDKFRVPWGIGIAIVIIVCFAAISVALMLLISSAATIAAVYPNYEARFSQVYAEIAKSLQLPFDADVSLLRNLWNQVGVRAFVQQAARSFSGSLAAFVKSVVVVTLLVAFFMVEIRTFRDKLAAAFPEAGKGRMTRIVNSTIRQISRYISIKFFISLLTGVCVAGGTFAAGLDFAAVWGFLAFALNFIPNFGSIFSGVVTTGFAALQFWPRPGGAALVGALMLAVNMALGNFVEPRVQGRNLGLSPFLILVSLSLWGWIWGFPGMILAVPMTAVMKIICENITMLRPFAVLMGSTAKPGDQPGDAEGKKAAG